MRLSTMLRTTAVLGLAVVAGLLGVSGTWALWNVAAPAEAGTIQAARLVAEVNGTPLLVDGTSTTVSLDEPSATLTPDNPVYASLTLTNNSTSTSGLELEAIVDASRFTSSNAALAGALTTGVTTGDCTQTTFRPTATARMTQGGSQQFCLRFALPAKASESLANTSATVAVPVSIEQVQ